ncbi:MAG: hypothetical protein M3083_07755 [Actinomycetota bacterium]|nr:hypothetical protein [Actinomycetota bacterium]MDQ6947187.1 hypothetical protein [Actinomycetota bacterium]
MAQFLFAIANLTGEDATYTSTEHAGDKCAVPNNAVTHTGGEDDNFVAIANCSGSEYFAAHHDTIQASGWTVTIWNDDDSKHLFYWSAGDFYSEQNSVPGSDSWKNVALVICPGPKVYCTQWT